MGESFGVASAEEPSILQSVGDEAVTSSADVGPDPDGAQTSADVLAQIGRLSPKAAEAIAAALGDGPNDGA